MLTYEKVKEFLSLILSKIKTQKTEDVKEEFEKSYRAFARQLWIEGHHDESTMYMHICIMYLELFDRPNELMVHKDFFNDLFDAFDELLSIKFNNSEEYGDKLSEFRVYLSNMMCYFDSNIVIHSQDYDQDLLAEIINCLHRGI